MIYTCVSDTNSKYSDKQNSNKQLHSFQAKVSDPKCRLCPNENHPIRKCPKFLAINYNQRINEIKKQDLCLNCFSKVHSFNKCTSKHNCYKCNKKHNTLLHKESNQTSKNPGSSFNTNSSLNSNSYRILNPYSPPFTQVNSNIQSTNPSSSGIVQSCFSTNSRDVLLGTAMVSVCHLGNRFSIRALIDSGSEGTFISERLFNLLKLPPQRVRAQISGLNNSISAQVQRQCSFIIGTDLDQQVEIPVLALVVPHLSSNLPSHSLPRSAFSNLPELPLADPNFHCSSKIDILIGGDIFPSIIGSGIRHNVCESLIAQETIFDWILSGPVARLSNPEINIVSHFCEISLDKEISRFWDVEDLPRKNHMSQSDRDCEDLYVQTTFRNSDGYVVSLPFKDDFQNRSILGNSRSSAMAQFLRNEAWLNKTPDFKAEYDRVVCEYEELDHE